MKIIVNSDNNVLTFHINEMFEVKSPSYYYTIDPGFRNGDETIEKCLENVKSIVNKWLSKIATSSVGDYFYFPFEYEDEYTGILRFELITNDKIGISFFQTDKIAGYSLIPSESSSIDINFEISDFNFETFVDKLEVLNIKVLEV